MMNASQFTPFTWEIPLMRTFLLVIACLFGQTTAANPNDQKVIVSITAKWEYKQISWDAKANTAAMQTQMDALGDQGWELTGTIARRTPDGADILLFKRNRVSDDVSIEFLEELDLAIVRGSKEAVEKTLSTIKSIKDQAAK